ncbi:HPr kinase/phosphorylase [Lutibaculum baratangense]|uniref:HPr kinase/phosphorylase C-terminal domain-containing protein n=1 Tax=Lutibaculum baratangense AMV1 TaxID=631454 RepID=V4TJ93_9HYPH|nr:HPr kinase/phosphatase C-terminal domain-containing protein [Lutibaculum baratangense]ESR25993.1 hypothetical protein N177_1328 [Lutibaculum baratangense AMV1]
MKTPLIAGTAVLIGAGGVLLRGPSGCGKSSLALSLIGRGSEDLPVRLVADDAAEAVGEDGVVVLRPPRATRGLIEIRGAGVRRIPFAEAAPLALVVDLSPDPERLPEPATCRTPVCGVDVPRVTLDPRNPANADIVIAIMTALCEGATLPFEDGPAPPPTGAQ